MKTSEFENGFGQFLNSREYEQVQESLFILARQAYAAGWQAAQKAASAQKEENVT